MNIEEGRIIKETCGISQHQVAATQINNTFIVLIILQLNAKNYHSISIYLQRQRIILIILTLI